MLNSRQFVGTFKVEKKVISANVCFLLLNKNKEIVGMSSSCIHALGPNMDKIHKHNVRVDVSVLAPMLFSQVQYMGSKTGARLEFFKPTFQEYERRRNDSDDFTGNEKSGDDYASDEEDEEEGAGEEGENAKTKEKDEDMYLDGNYGVEYKVDRSDEVAVFQCTMSEIAFQSFGGELRGYYVRLEGGLEKSVPAKMGKPGNKSKFQFNFDPISLKYVRELRDRNNRDVGQDRVFLEYKKYLKEHPNKEKTSSLITYMKRYYVKEHCPGEANSSVSSAENDEAKEETKGEKDTLLSAPGPHEGSSG